MYYCPTCESSGKDPKLVFIEGVVTCTNHPPDEVDILWRSNDPVPAQEHPVDEYLEEIVRPRRKAKR